MPDPTGPIVTEFMGPREVPTRPCFVALKNVTKFQCLLMNDYINKFLPARNFQNMQVGK